MFICFCKLIRIKKHETGGATILENGDDVEHVWRKEERQKHIVRA